jgi:LuxR family transcriptional regulator, maltose regulon positive regulatory protein
LPVNARKRGTLRTESRPRALHRMAAQVPLIPASYVQRRSLHEWAQKVLAAPTTIIQAPAGYGKTTLLAQLRQLLRENGTSAHWVATISADREPESFLAALGASCGMPENPQAQPPERQLTQFASWLAQQAQPSCLLLDDADRLNDSPSGRLLYELIEALPPAVHIVCTGRSSPELPRARERGYGRLFELGTRQLSFVAEDVVALLTAGGAATPERAELERFLGRSEGWPMIVRREVEAIAAGGDYRGVVDRLTGKRHDIADFFEAEVLRDEREEMLRVLEATAICEQPNGPLLAALTGLENAHALLDEACERGLFVSATDESRSCYRLQRLFSEALRLRLERRSPSQAAALHQRAAEWYESSGGLVEAVDHAIQGGDTARAARIFEMHSDDFYETGHESAILPVASRIPAGLRWRHPRMLLAMSWRLLAEWQFEKARTLLARAQTRIDEMAGTGECESSVLTELRHQLLHGRLMMAQYEDNFAFIEGHAEALLRSYSGTSPYIRGSMHAAMLSAAREQYRLGRIDSLEVLARQQFQAVESRYVTVFLEAIIAPAYLIRGRAQAAIITLSAALRTALEVSGPTLGSLVALPLAEAYYDRGEIEQSLNLLETYLPHSREVGFADQLICGCTTRARIARIRGERDASLYALEEAIQFASERSFERLTQMLVAERIDLLCRWDAASEAAKAGTRIGLRRSSDSVMPGPRTTRARGALAYAWTSIALSRGRFADAIRVARKWRNLTEAAGALRDALRWSVRLTVLLQRAGDDYGARRELHRAIVAAAPAGLTQPFLEEIDLLTPLLEGVTDPSHPTRAVAADSATLALLEWLAKASGGESARSVQHPPVEASILVAASPEQRLSPRETEILTLAGGGLSNAEIGQRLSLVEGTVKWHFQRIFDKFGTRRRLIVLERARAMGILR